MTAYSDAARDVEANRVTDLMKEYTWPALAAVYGVVSEQKGMLLGSGTFLRLCGRHYILTAEHVIDEGKKYATIAHTSKDAAKPELFKYPFKIAKPPIDLALARVDDSIITDNGIKPWGVEVLRGSAADFKRDILFCHGYTEELSKWVPIVNGGISSTSRPFWTTDGETDWVSFDDTKHLAINYPRDGWYDEQGRPMAMPLPEGLSGSLVWQTNRKPPATQATWTPKQSHVLGLIHLWNKAPESLIATRIETVREFLLEAVRQETAYEFWEARGRPLWDDQRDWFEAVEQIPDLW